MDNRIRKALKINNKKSLFFVRVILVDHFGFT